MAFVSRLLAATPEYAEERPNDLKTITLTMLGNMTFEGTSAERTGLAKKQTREQIDSLFQDFALALSAARTIRGESGKH